MDYTARIQELEEKLEREGLTEAEMAEINLYSSLALRALDKSLKNATKLMNNLMSDIEQ